MKTPVIVRPISPAGRGSNQDCFAGDSTSFFHSDCDFCNATGRSIRDYLFSFFVGEIAAVCCEFPAQLRLRAKRPHSFIFSAYGPWTKFNLYHYHEITRKAAFVTS
jgi:hypothetical protein